MFGYWMLPTLVREIRYLFRASFTGGDVTLANTNTVGITGSGATHEGYVDEGGNLTVVNTSTGGTMTVTSNEVKCVVGGSGTATTTPNLSLYHPAQAISDGTVLYCKSRIGQSNANQYNELKAGSAAGTAFANRVVLARAGVSDKWNIITFDPAGTVKSNQQLTGAPTAAQNHELALVWNADRSLWHAYYSDNGGSWTLIAAAPGIAGTLYPAIAFNMAINSQNYFDDFKIVLAHWTTMDSPAGYAVDDAVVESDTYTHVADHYLHLDNVTLPSSGNIDVVFRTDWAVRISSAGAVTILEDYDGSGGGPTTRATSGGTLSAGGYVDVRMAGTTIELWVDGGDKASYTSASANQTDTGGEVASLGTGGAIGSLLSLPLTSADHDNKLGVV